MNGWTLSRRQSFLEETSLINHIRLLGINHENNLPRLRHALCRKHFLAE